MEDHEDIKNAVRERYGAFAESSSSCCGPQKSCGCGSQSSEDISANLGYTKQQINSVPDGSNLGLGCGNPVAIASLKPGETVLDLGSGAGFDCFLAANQVGKTGKVIGVDMTPAMLTKARRNAATGGYTNVEFRLGEIENLPAADNSVDVIISNCVINLAPDKARVFAEAYRVLKPGGRFMISDIVLTAELPDFIRESVQAYVGCISGALLKDNYIAIVKNSGFTDTKILSEKTYPIDELLETPGAMTILKKTGGDAKAIGSSVLSITLSASKPQR
jgi:SAM-dependent methyltransferase